MSLALLRPQWPAPSGVVALSTTRLGGVSRGPYASLNLAGHVGDAPEAVAANRRILLEAGRLPAAPVWLEQVHGTRVLRVDGPVSGSPRADAAISERAGVVCAVMTADCAPVLICDRRGREVAAVHAGWRGCLGGVLESAVQAFGAPASELLAWIGPCIGPQAFEVGPELRAAFLAVDAGSDAAFVRSAAPGRWLADLPALVRRRLRAAGVSAISASGLCTFSDARRCFSYRRDGRCGRMATLIWRQGPDGAG